MSEEYVSRLEFENLKHEVEELKNKTNENKTLLTTIDKKIDVITERISSGDKMDELKLKPIQNKLDELEDNQKWTNRTLWGAIIGVAVKVLFDVMKMLKP